MDVKRLSTWSRDDLEREARRIGVWAPQNKERAELERRIRDHHAAPVQRARRFFRKAVSFAKTLAPALPAPTPAHKEPEPAPPASKESVKAKVEEAPDSNADSNATTPTERTERKSRPTARRRVEPAEGEIVDPEAAATLLAEAELEPIPTRTMARLLGEQGHTRRALAIYQKLLRDNPSDGSLRDEAATLRAKRERGAAKVAADDDDDSHGGEVVLARGDGHQLIVAWFVPPAAVQRAQSVLGRRGVPTARVVVVRPSSAGGIVRETHDLGRSFDGEGTVPAPPGCRVTASIGVRSGDHFVSIAHAAPVRL